MFNPKAPKRGVDSTNFVNATNNQSDQKKRQNSQSNTQQQTLPKMPKKRGTINIGPSSSSAAQYQQEQKIMSGFIVDNDGPLNPSSGNIIGNQNAGSNAMPNPSLPASNGNINQAAGPVSLTGGASSTSLAETLQSCYTNILDLEKRNQQYNVMLNQAIFRLGQSVKQVIGLENDGSSDNNATIATGMMPNAGQTPSQQIPGVEVPVGNNPNDPSFIANQQLRLEHNRNLITQKHVGIQKTLVLAYANNLELLDAYYDFVLYSLRGGSSATDGGALSSNANPKSINNIFSGYQVLQVYKISRRLWIYGIINLLENMKNLITVVMAIPPNYHDLSMVGGANKQNKNNMIHLENELCVNFISHCFSLLSTLVEMNNNLTIEVDSDPNTLFNDLTSFSGNMADTDESIDNSKVLSTVSLIADFQNWWYEKIADLSRMSIALYPSSCIDWEASAEHWYLKAISGNYGHGKTYYHLATVQQPSASIDKNGNSSAFLNMTMDQSSMYGSNSPTNSATGNDISLEALFNLGKSVFVKDCFVPTGHYLRMVLDSMFAQSKISSYSLYESALVHLTCGNGTILIDKNKVTAVDNLSNWELIVLLYIRISKVLLVSNFNSSPELIKLVSNFSRTFGSIDFISGEDFPSFHDYSNPTNPLSPPSANTPISSTNPMSSIGSPMSLDPFANPNSITGGDNASRLWMAHSQNQYNHQAIKVSFFEKESSALGPHNINNTTKSMLIDKPSIKLLNFWFNKSGNLASINIWQLVGFGVLNFKNLFSILFELPIALKERQERKETKKNRKASTASLNNPENDSKDNQQAEPPVSSKPQTTTADLDSLLKDPYPIVTEMSTFKWYESLQFINKSSLELSFRMLKKFLNCPFKSVSTPHIIVWLYFLVALGKVMEKNPACEPVVLNTIFKKLFPWDSLVNYLNFWVNEARECFDFDDLKCGFNIMDDADENEFIFEQNLILQIKKMYALGHEGYLNYFNENETLIEVWKLWGSLWFDVISEKKNYLNLKFAGWKGKDFLSDYINKNEELLYILKPDLNSQDNIQRSHNTNNNYFRDLFSEGDNCDRTNHKINLELHEKETRFKREQDYKNGTFNSNAPSPERNDRRLFNSVEKERIKRILLVAIYISERFPQFGLRLTDRLFKLDVNPENDPEDITHPTANNSEEIHKNTLIFEFATDSRFTGLYESISDVNIFRETDPKFDINLFLKSKNNYEHVIEEKQAKNYMMDDDDKSMANSEYSKVDVSMNLVNNGFNPDADLDGSVMDETDSLLNYELARKALGVDGPSGNEALRDANEPDHLISPEMQSGERISPFDSVQSTPQMDGLTLPYVKFMGNITMDIDTSISYVTFDTNSWLKNCGKIYKIFKSCTLNDNVNLKLKIALPLLVYQELRSLRKSEDSFLSDSATRCVITIKNLYNDHTAYFKKKYGNSINKIRATHLLLLKPDGKITLNLHDPCDIPDQNLTFKAIDDSILQSVLNSSKIVRQNYIYMLKEKYQGNIDNESYLEFDNGHKKVNIQDLYVFKYNILITDTRPLRLKARSVTVNAYQCKWLFYNLEKINLEGACLD
ncbi:Esl2 protein [Saccharomycopsis crataegensis]|uniref:Esl2 protein n=1 Tax=Saccharomycopsis crataegensis TaxID=43959 RepID=A0AAV5QQD6_9ASCO|nr:Esl2 protein [Saccharomycopsis crataegensis]